MEHLLQQCTQRFGRVPRRFWPWTRGYMNIPDPFWLKDFPKEELGKVFKYAPNVFATGRVVWGHIIQANALLYREGDDDCPGELVYSFDSLEQGESYEEYLGDVAHDLYGLKGTHPKQPELATIAEYLTNERIRVFGLEVPPVISPTYSCQISTTYFVRKHLPGRRLIKMFLPIVVQTKAPYVALVLPERYWPQELLDWWTSRG